MLFKKLEWGLEDNQVRIKYYIFNKNNDNYNTISLIHFFNDSTRYILGIVLGSVNTEENKIK